MAEQAKITSLDALESFRANIIIFLSRAHRPLDEVGDDVRRMRQWLQNDQRMHWESQLRARRRKLAQLEQELMSARLSALRDSVTAQELAVKKAKEAVAEAEEKLRRIKLWNRDFDHRAEPLLRKLQSMRNFLDHDMPKAISYLLQAQMTLESYTEAAPSPGNAPQAPPAETGAEASTGQTSA